MPESSWRSPPLVSLRSIPATQTHPMKNFLFAVISLVVVATVAFYVLAIDPATFQENVDVATPAPLAAPDAPIPTPVVVTPEVAPQPEESRREEVVSEVEAETEKEEEAREPLASWDSELSQWLDVTVVLPTKAPADSTLVVLAIDSALGRREIYGRRGLVPERQRLQKDTSYKGLLAVAPVDADGFARIAFPPDVETPHIVVSGRYLYSTQARAVDLEAGKIELRPELGAWITGRLLPPDGLEGEWGEAEVRLATDLSALISLGTSSGNRLDMRQKFEIGSQFEFLAVPMSTSFTIGVESDALALFAKEGNESGPGEHFQLDIQLNAGSLVKGRVVNGEGKPVAGADIEARTREFFGNLAFELREGESDEDGYFELPAVGAGPAWLTVEHEEYRNYKSPNSVEIVLGQELTYPDIVLDLGAHVSGSIMFPDGTPAVGAELEIGVDFSANTSGVPMNPVNFSGAGNETTTDERGEFSFAGLSTGPYRLDASLETSDDSKQASGIWRGQIAGLTPVEDVEASTQLLLVLEAPTSISGIVLDTNGEPVQKFKIEAALAAAQWYLPPSRTESEEFESEDGSFTIINLQPGKWSLLAKAEGLAPPEAIELELPSEEVLEFRLASPASLSGFVFDPDGNPVAGAVIQQELDLQQMVQRQQGRLDNIPSATTDVMGAFTLDNLPPGTGTVMASKDGWARSSEYPYELEEGDAIADAELVLRVGGTITGILFDEEGEPKVGADIFIQQPTGMRRRTTRTDEKGEFREEHLDPAQWQVMALKLTNQDGDFDQAEMMSSMKISMVDLVDGGEEHVTLGALPDNPVIVTGLVTSDGDAIPKTMVSFVPSNGGGFEKMKLASTDENGEYKVILTEPGDYLVTVQQVSIMGQQNSLEYRRRIPDGEDFVLNFELPVGRIGGTVYGPEGEPLANARITLNKDGGAEFGTMFGGRYAEATTDDGGAYVLENLRPGAYLIAAGGSILGGAFGENKNGGGRTVSQVEVGEGQWVRGVDFHLEASGTIKGLVVDHAGFPVDGATLFVRNENGNLLEIFSFLKTDAGGRFEYKELAPGVYTVAARKDQLASSESEHIRIRSGEATDCKLVMDPGTLLTVALQDKSGELVPSVISVTDSEGREMNGMLSLDDLMAKFSSGVGVLEQEVGPLPPGTYAVRAVTDDGRSTKKTVTLSGQEKRKLRLRLK
ncbi:MAG: protocatechuate 3,4-dioxygenase beta subunit [Planctomycetota bacterium]|jgi:protocatechuate 3,4-dioxygenase beta subunit